MSAPATTPAPTEAESKPVQQFGDRLFAGSARGAGILILVVLAGVAAFLVVQAIPALFAPADQLPGVRAILDRCAGDPSDDAMAHVMAVATGKERQMLAVLAGRVSGTDVEPHGQRVGEELEDRARAGWSEPARGRRRAPTRSGFARPGRRAGRRAARRSGGCARLPLTIPTPKEQRSSAGKNQKNGEVGRARHRPEVRR